MMGVAVRMRFRRDDGGRAGKVFFIPAGGMAEADALQEEKQRKSAQSPTIVSAHAVVIRFL